MLSCYPANSHGTVQHSTVQHGIQVLIASCVTNQPTRNDIALSLISCTKITNTQRSSTTDHS